MEEITREKKRSFWGGILAGVFITGTLLTILFIILMEKENALVEQRFGEVTSAAKNTTSSSSSSSADGV